MKVEPAFVHTPLPAPALGTAAGAEFGLLIEAGRTVDDASRAAGFQDRGMFGRHGATPPAGSVRPELMVTAPAESSGQTLVHAVQVDAAVPGHATAPASPGVQTEPAPRAPTLPPNPTRHGLVPAGGAEETLAKTEAIGGEELRAGGARSRRSRAATPPPSRQLHLSRADDLGVAHLVVRATGLDPGEIAEFRARAEILLRERGLTLDKVRINGEDHPAVVLSGGSSRWP